MRYIQGIVFVLVLFVYHLTYAATQRFISLSPAATEILFALGLKDEIIADTTFCNFPEEAKKLPKVGTFSEPNIEKILSLKPDIIFTTGLEQAPSVARLQSLGLKVIVSDPKNIFEFFASIMQIGKATSREEAAGLLIETMQKRIDAIKSQVAMIPQDKRPKVFIEIWYDPIMTAGPNSIVNEILTIAGANNIAYDTNRPYSRFSAEAIIQRNPDVIILGYMAKKNTKDLVSKRLGWKNINAIKNNRVISDIDPDLILRPSPRIVEGIEEIYKHLYHE
jgi:iron complex transport system substrate-binding protein